MREKSTARLPGGFLLNMAALVFCLTVTACGNEDPLPVYPEAGVKNDGIVWPDYGNKDFGGFKKDKAVKKDTEPQDGGVDGQVKDGGNCVQAQATCSSTCGAKEYCTEASGGSCIPLTALAGDPTKKEVILSFLKAVIPCWRDSSDDNVCATVDTCQMTGDLTNAMVTDWMCNEAQILDFPNSADYEEAKDICGCDAYLEDLDWKLSVIRPGEKGKICLIYNTDWLNEIFIDDCKNFPY